jgi:hypothetical protein
MLLRLIVGLVLLGFVYSVVRATFFPKKALPGEKLKRDELTRLRQLAKGSPRVQEALSLRDEIHRVIDEHPTSQGDSGIELEARVDAVTRQLLEQANTRAKVEGALARFDANTHAEEILDAETKLAAETDADSRTALKETLARLQSQGEHLDRLRRRAEQLEHAEKQIVVELRNVHLALLDAASSKAGLGDDRVQEIRTSLAEAAETLRQTTDADEELTRLLRGAEAQREG